MLRFSAATLLVLLCQTAFTNDDPDAIYKPGPESERVDGVPVGNITKHVWDTSSVFEGTTREYYVYIPKQYDGTHPACLMVFQDGHAYVNESGQARVPLVLDNLIHRGELPVMIAVFINPGHKGDTQPENRWRANNRSFEYDTLSNQYAHFVKRELLPHIVNEQKLNISADPADVCIAGASSGGICAFTAAWIHPEWFGKVLSHIGSFTNIRGGHVYPALIRKTAQKPIRVFLQDGENDLDNEHGNWWLSNLQMEAALKFAKYDYQFVAGTGRHSMAHGGAILPDSLRWLWRDHILPQTQKTENVNATDVFEPKTLELTAGPDQGKAVQYRLLAPANLQEGQTYPLVVFLHGAGERGSDNEKQLQYLPSQLGQPSWRERFPCYVLAPQCPGDDKWVEADWALKESHTLQNTPTAAMSTALQILDKTLADAPIDRSRIYLTGLSMGGFGSWDLALRRPELFAAVAPICGGADNSKLSLLKDVPIWVAHGDADNVVPVDRSRSAVAALREAGGRPVYVELPDVGHNSWTPSYQDQDGLVPWMFRQRKPSF